MVTKRQQLEWLAKRFESLPFDSDSILMIDEVLGYMGYEHKITNQEIKLERDKMSSKPEPDNSWHERMEFPPAGCECEVLHRGKWIKTVIIGMSPYKSCIYSLIGSGSDHAYDGIANSYFFSPLRTEREKAIDEMISVTLAVINQDTQRQMFGMLYDAGYRKVNGDVR